MSDWKRMTEGIRGTIELTEDSSQELLRILEEQEAEFFNELFEGKRDLTIKGSDGRSVELTPKENELKFYCVDSIDDYWIGQRLDNFYYAEWKDGYGFVWTHSRYLPWGEHIVAEDTLWKEHTYPSEPREIPFTEWIVGFMKKFTSEDAISREWLLNELDEWGCDCCDIGENLVIGIENATMPTNSCSKMLVDMKKKRRLEMLSGQNKEQEDAR